MKKILAVSLGAIMAVSAARADIASVEYVEKQTGVLTDLTTTAKGNLVGAINELNTAVGTKAAQADFNTLQNTVTTNENEIEGKVSALSKTVTDKVYFDADLTPLSIPASPDIRVKNCKNNKYQSYCC